MLYTYILLFFTVVVKNGEYWRIITSSMSHFHIIHLVFNMFSLYSIGPLEYYVINNQQTTKQANKQTSKQNKQNKSKTKAKQAKQKQSKAKQAKQNKQSKTSKAKQAKQNKQSKTSKTKQSKTKKKNKKKSAPSRDRSEDLLLSRFKSVCLQDRCSATELKRRIYLF